MAAIWEAVTHTPLLLEFLLLLSADHMALSLLACEAGCSATSAVSLADHQVLSLLQLSVRWVLRSLRPANHSAVAATPPSWLIFFFFFHMWPSGVTTLTLTCC